MNDTPAARSARPEALGDDGARELDGAHAATARLHASDSVTAVLVTRGANPWFRRTLAAVHAQARTPDRIVVVDVTASPAASGYDDLHLGDARFVPAPGARSFGEGVAVALAGDDVVSSDGWIWLLHDDSVPAPAALDRLLVAVEHSRTIAVAGPKQRRWPEGRAADQQPGPDEASPAPRLVEVGITTSRAGRRTAGFDVGEIDQGQYDARDDVLAVGLAGALVRREVWDALGGTDPDLGPFGDGIDLCRRARLAGHRVVVVADAVVEHVQLSLRSADPAQGVLPVADVEPVFAARRRSEVRLRLTGCAPVWFPFLAVWLVVAAPLHAMYRLAVKQPGHARDELLAPVLVLARPASLWRARRRAARTATLPRRTLGPLQASWRDVQAERRWRRMAAAEQRRAVYAPSELERAELAQLAVRRHWVAGGVVVALVALSGIVFTGLVGPALGGSRFVGGSLLPLSVSFTDLWRTATSGWVPGGFGAAAPADPVQTILLGGSVATFGHPQIALDLLVVGFLVVAGLGAWCAAGALTRWNAGRVWAAVVWVAAPAGLLALSGGRLGPMLVHAGLPWFVVALLRGIGVARDDRVAPAVAGAQRKALPRERGSLGALAAAALLLVPVVAGAPILAAIAVLAVLLTLIVSWRRAAQHALVLVPAAVVLAPFWWYVVGTWGRPGLGWHLLVASPGPAVPFDVPSGWEAALGWPQAATAPFGLDGRAGQVAPYVLVGLVGLLALVAVFRSRRPAGVVLAWCVVAGGLAAAFLAAGTPVATSAAGLVRGWPGPGISVALAGLLGAALLAVPGRERVRTMYDEPSYGPRALRAVAVVVGLAVPIAAATSWVQTSVHDGDDPHVGLVSAQDSLVVPPVAQHMQDSTSRQRILTLTPTSTGSVRYAVLAGDGTQLTETSAVTEGALAGRATTGRGIPGTPEAAVAQLVGDLTGPGVAPSSSTTATQLADLGVGGVLMAAPTGRADERGTSGARTALAARIDTVPGLARVTQGQSSTLWRVAPSSSADRAPAWASLRSPSGTQLAALPAGVDTVRTHVAASGSERRLVLAERSAAAWHARLGGVALHRVGDGWQQVFVVPAGASGTLTVGYDPPNRIPWLVGSAIVLLITALLALPVRRRKVVLR